MRGDDTKGRSIAMTSDARTREYRREELALIAILLVFFVAIVAFAVSLPFDARLFPLIIGSAGILLSLGVAVEALRRGRVGDASAPDASAGEDDAAARAGWPRYLTALFAAPVFGLLFWLFGFVVAALAAMLLMPPLMGYADRKRLIITALVTVVVLALVAPKLLNVDLPHGVVGDWLIDVLSLRGD
jgi:Tripartite tricarboxylate transporter TctB family